MSRIVEYTKDIFIGCYEIITDKKGYKRSMFVNQIYFFGALSLSMVLVVSFFLGLVLTLQFVPELGRFGAETLTGGMVMVSLAREVSPVVISIMIAGRMGSAMAAELGSMNITNQIDSLKLMAVNPIRYLVAPKVLSSIIMLPFLTMISIFAGGLGSYIMAVFFYDISYGAYLEKASEMFRQMDVIGGVSKTIAFGFVISFISCYKGIFLRGSSTEVSRATTDSVAYSIVAIIVVNLFLSYLIFS
ncbi:MAG TPA: ABC transporter permease [Fusobacteria bacterium]|nr:ABC transporter permease [Fusobacteriota bacterium]